jgi:prepilin-type N-terminal cleavage/methylation domain-containing protein
MSRVARRLARDESGFTLVELLTSMALMVIVLSATLGTLDVFGSTTARDQKLLQAQDQARIAIDRAARELRNASAYATDSNQPSAIQRAGAWDLIMEAVNPQAGAAGNLNTLNLMRIRYCVNTITSTAWRQMQTWTTAAAPAMITDPACPSPNWGNQSVIATDVVNGGTRRVFTYNSGDPTDVNSSPPALEDITSVRIALWVDIDPAAAPPATQVNTGVFLRNKNRRPVADCTAAPTGNRYVSLNGSHSSDPEGALLTFAWADGGTTIASPGALVNYQVATTGSHTFTVTVTDPGGLSASVTCQANVV